MTSSDDQLRRGISIVVPCFNEEAIIEATAKRLISVLEAAERPFEVIFCDDGSRDGTLAKLQRLGLQDARITVIGYTQNRGAGYAYRCGIGAARGDIIIHMDADLSMSPELVVPLCMAQLSDKDIAIASRYFGVKADYPLYRRVPSYIYRQLYKVLLGLGVRDAMSGFFGVRRSALETIGPLSSDGFEVYLELFAKAQRKGLSIIEVGIPFSHQTDSGEVSVIATAPKQLLSTLRVWLSLVTARD